MPKLLIILLFSSFILKAQVWTNEHAELHKQIVSFSNADLDNRISAPAAQNPKNESYLYLHGLYSFTKAIVEADPAYSETFLSLCKELIDRLADIDGPYALAFKGELRFFEAFIEFREEHEVYSSYSFVKAYKAASELEEKYPNFVPGIPVRVIVNCLLSSIPEDIYDYLAFLGFEGDRNVAKKLIQQLEDQSSDPSYKYLETYLFFLKDYWQVQFNPANYQPAVVSPSLEGNPLILVYRSLYYVNNRHSKEAKIIFDSLQTVDLGLEAHFMDYFQGKCEMQLLDPNAMYTLKRFVDKSPGVDYKKSANLYLSWYYLLNDKPDLASYYKSQIPKTGRSRVGFDSYAERMYSEPFHKDLVTSLLHFDAGSFKESEQVLLALDDSGLNPLQKIEKAYRLGRIKQETQNFDPAIVYFKKCLELPAVASDYMQPNSCLQLAKIYLKQGKKEDAKKYLERCLEYDDYPYDSGLKYEAKNLLKSM